MSTSRRNVIIRSVASIAGDIAIGVAVANVCIWAIQAATLGLFLSFLVWLLGALLSLALSQFVVHPAVKALLSDRKLDAGLSSVANVWIDEFQRRSFCNTKSILGSALETRWAAPSNGSSLDRTRIRSSDVITFPNLCVGGKRLGVAS